MSNDQEQTAPPPMPRGAVDDPAWNSEALDPEDQERKAEIDQVIDPVVSMQNRPDTKNLTLGEIKKRDEDNLSLVLASSREHRFDTLPEALRFIHEVIGRAMTKVGVTALAEGAPMPQKYGALTSIPGGLYTPKAREEMVAKQMVMNDVRVEVRHPQQYPDPKDMWKAGMYIYHRSEIAFFVSNPMANNNTVGAGGRIVTPHAHPQRFFVKTNMPGA